MTNSQAPMTKPRFGEYRVTVEGFEPTIVAARSPWEATCTAVAEHEPDHWVGEAISVNVEDSEGRTTDWRAEPELRWSVFEDHFPDDDDDDDKKPADALESVGGS